MPGATSPTTTPDLPQFAARGFVDGLCVPATISEVALAWVIQKYDDIVVAIPGACKPHHVEEAASAQKLSLSDVEPRRLSDLSSRVTG